MSNNSTIRCPNCKHEFPIGNALAQEIEAEIRNRYMKRFNEDKQKMEEERAALAKTAEQLKLQQEQQARLVDDKVRAVKLQLEEEAMKKASEEMNARLQLMNKELEEKSRRLRESQERELQMLQKEKALKEREQAIELEMEKRMLSREKEVEERVRKIESERHEMKLKEMEKKLADQKELAETMQRKAEQGSMQLQGEVMELALEDLLRSTFPFDQVDEVAKGVRGADCVQQVRNVHGQVCGRIIYESKRTKAFTQEWIEKLKSDMRATQADIAVIVTETLPREMSSFGFKDGVWICRFQEVKPMAYLLRDSLIRIHEAVVSQDNKGEKMQMLFDYLTGNEFRQSVEAIVEGFVSLRDGITREKIQMEKIWKEREKQLDKVLLNTSRFYGSVKGIAGNSVGNIHLLEE